MFGIGTIIKFSQSKGIGGILSGKTLKSSVLEADTTKEAQNRMLILTRKAGESILIGDDIEVTITSIDQNKVRVGIKGPAHVPIYREELYRKIQKENRAAALIGKEEFEGLLNAYTGDRQGEAPDRE